MLFEIIDHKQHCKNIFSENKIISDPDYDKLSQTWAFHSTLKDYNIEYASLYAQSKTLDQCCPDKFKDEWTAIKEKYGAYIKSFQNGFCELDEHCFYDLVPQSFVIEFFSIKNKITEYVLSTYEKPANYNFLVEATKLITSIRDHKLNINTDPLIPKLHQLKVRSFYTKIFSCASYIDYNLFGTITGRLSTKKDSFPILTMNKDYRSVIEPTNDWFIELDFNAAELRCLLSLNDQPQPEEDIHQWHGNIFNKLSDRKMNRDEIKRKIFGWLYGPLGGSLGIQQIEKYYDKRKVIDKYWNGKEVINPFGRQIKADEFHALNAIIQSTTSDTFLRRAIAVNKLLEHRNSFTMGLIHDSMIIDFDRSDKDILNNIIEEFSETKLGKFKVNVSLGTHFGNMKRFR